MTKTTPVGQSLWSRINYACLVVFVVLTDIYSVIMILLLAAKYLLGEQSWMVGLFNSMFPSILLPALILLPLSLYIRRWRIALFLLPTLATFILNYGILFLPRGNSLDSSDLPLAMLTFNLHYAEGELTPVTDIVYQSGADIVLFQELMEPTADDFINEFTETYPYHAMQPHKVDGYGKGFLSRYPILSVEYHEDVRMIYQRVELDFHGNPLVIYNVHPVVPHYLPPYNSVQRSSHIAEILALAQTEISPVLIAGDFNMTDQSDDYKRVTAVYRDTFREVGSGLGLTFPASDSMNIPLIGSTPLIRLDYVFHSDHFQAIEAHVWPSSGGSDHRPLFARLALETTS